MRRGSGSDYVVESVRKLSIVAEHADIERAAPNAEIFSSGEPPSSHRSLICPRTDSTGHDADMDSAGTRVGARQGRSRRPR